MATKVIVVPKEGWENIYNDIVAMKENFEARKEVARQEALAKVDEQFVDEQSRIDKAFEAATKVEEVEVEEEVPVAEEVVSAEETY